MQQELFLHFIDVIYHENQQNSNTISIRPS